MSASTIFVVILVLLLLGALPTWPYSSGWGYYPSGGLGLVVLILGRSAADGPPLSSFRAPDAVSPRGVAESIPGPRRDSPRFDAVISRISPSKAVRAHWRAASLRSSNARGSPLARVASKAR